MRHEQQKDAEGLGVNVKSIVTIGVVLTLVMFAVHCTWVTSNAYSSPSIVLASYSQDGYFILFFFFLVTRRNIFHIVNSSRINVCYYYLHSCLNRNLTRTKLLPLFISPPICLFHLPPFLTTRKISI